MASAIQTIATDIKEVFDVVDTKLTYIGKKATDSLSALTDSLSELRELKGRMVAIEAKQGGLH
eukprot:1857057-Heterocapsa_arctica.AAC.1